MDNKDAFKTKKNIMFNNLILNRLRSKFEFCESKIDKLVIYIFSFAFLLSSLILIIKITPSVYAQNFAKGFTQSAGKQTVNINGYAPLLNNWAYVISSQGKIYMKTNKIYPNEKIPIYVQTFGTNKVPLRDQTIFLTSPDARYGLHII